MRRWRLIPPCYCGLKRKKKECALALSAKRRTAAYIQPSRKNKIQIGLHNKLSIRRNQAGHMFVLKKFVSIAAGFKFFFFFVCSAKLKSRMFIPKAADTNSSFRTPCAASCTTSLGRGLLCVERGFRPARASLCATLARESPFSQLRGQFAFQTTKTGKKKKKERDGDVEAGQTRLLCAKTRGPSYYLCMQRDV